GQRQMISILGESDTRTVSPLDVSPAANLEGANRFERGTIFFNYLQDFYGPAILSHQVRETVPGVGHAGGLMNASSPALKWVFDFQAPTSGTISGTVFQDINRNGVRDAGEPGLAGQTVFLDLSGSGVLESADPTTTTDAAGSYQFTVSPGTYTVRQV